MKGPRLHVGTSGFSYGEWRGSFYPEDLPASRMLAYYQAHFGSVEINNTFYRMPKPGVLEGWREEVADDFAFVLKAPMGLTNLKDRALAAVAGAHFLGMVRDLGSRFGTVLVQLPSYMKRSEETLTLVRGILDLVPAGVRVALEPSDDSWHHEELYTLLRRSNVALVTVDDTKKSVPLVATTSWGYVRLRRGKYTKAELTSWAMSITKQPWKEAFVFFKHDDEGTGPRLGTRFKAAASP